MFLARIFNKSHLTRQSAAASLDTSAATTRISGGESAGNSAPASRNVAEFSRKLDDVLNGLECDLPSRDDNRVVDRLEEIGGQYTNSSLPDNIPEWTCSTETAKLVQLCAQVSKDAYEKAPLNRKRRVDPDSSGGDSDTAILFPETINGTFKATLVVEHKHSLEIDASQTILISIRGSTSKIMDWITNFNCDLVLDTDSFFPPLNDVGDTAMSVGIHTGFLRVATSMGSQVEQILRDRVTSFQDDPPTMNLVFTGHSAGGAVAALLFGHMFTPGVKDLLSRFHRVHCITFGTPPIFTPEHLLDQSIPASSLFISIINQGDPVPRADKLYLHALVDLYSQSVTGDTAVAVADQVWNAPLMTTFNAGMLIVLRIEDEEEAELDVHAYCIQAKDMQGLLAVRLKMHKMQHYVEMVDAFVKRQRL